MDLLIGGNGNDTITGGRGNDVAQLGTGNDLFIWNPGDGSDVVYTVMRNSVWRNPGDRPRPVATEIAVILATGVGTAVDAEHTVRVSAGDVLSLRQHRVDPARVGGSLMAGTYHGSVILPDAASLGAIGRLPVADASASGAPRASGPAKTESPRSDWSLDPSCPRVRVKLEFVLRLPPGSPPPTLTSEAVDAAALAMSGPPFEVLPGARIGYTVVSSRSRAKAPSDRPAKLASRRVRRENKSVIRRRKKSKGM